MELFDRILSAQSDDQIIRIVGSLGDIRQAGIEVIITDLIKRLYMCSPMNVDSRQWNNIKLARIELQNRNA